MKLNQVVEETRKIIRQWHIFESNEPIIVSIRQAVHRAHAEKKAIQIITNIFYSEYVNSDFF